MSQVNAAGPAACNTAYLFLDSSDYPRNHDYFVFATSENAPEVVTTVLEEAQPLFGGSSIQDVLSSISQIVDNALSGRHSHSLPQAPHDDDNYSTSEEDDVFDEEMDWDENSEDDIALPLKNESEIRQVLRRDLRAVKNAGFKVGYLGTVTGAIIVSVSCRVGRLGISRDAMQAWDVSPSEYLVLLIRYPLTYVDLHMVLHRMGNTKSNFIQMHIGLCSSYKPGPEQAVKVFQGQASETQRERWSSEGTETTLRPFFISRTLNALLNERFIAIVNQRMKIGFSWTGAELYVHHNQGKSSASYDSPADEYFEPDSWGSSAPAFLAADHIANSDCDPSQLSLPLLAMQFTLRHFVKCTEFCLVCHCRVRDSFEALKPYVCSSSLCLYQYMALGLGPSIEYEIRSQPYVVDMLISLTYSRAISGQLEDFPTGLGLMVPRGLECTTKYRQYNGCGDLTQQSTSTPYTAELDQASMVLYISNQVPLKVGDWIVVMDPENQSGTKYAGDWHCRVKATDTSNYIQISDPINHDKSPRFTTSINRRAEPVKFWLYDTNFDELTTARKREVIPMLLDTLPDIECMNSFLSDTSNGGSLSAWRDKISPPALDVLRWIVASNRSCIMHDDDNDPENRVSGMEGYMQFRLVQGAPDKEQKFTNAVRHNALQVNPNHPTLFAWHGSPLHNWHSILREGLWFKEAANGRSYGNGVYMASDFETSLGYTRAGVMTGGIWPRSTLNIRMAISLNEVVNNPQRFVCNSPYYVVKQLDWIQPRYLFVTSNGYGPYSYDGDVKHDTGSLPTVICNQDPKRIVKGPKGKPISIPASILGSRRSEKIEQNTKPIQDKKKRSSTNTSARATKKRRNSTIDEADNEDNFSIATSFEDQEILLSDTEDNIKQATAQPKSNINNSPSPKTDFQPGTLQEETLPLLNPPAYATTPATKVLQQHLNATLKVQDRESLADLGWYVDPNLISTVYQWIVELHTFDPSLPLAQDLKKQNLKSVVLELRFPPAYPMAPPFVRVIRPRFLEWSNGGGGHVTAGGAMCMELLTNSGWLPTASIESVLLQVRMAITNTEPRPARLALRSGRKDYRVGEAVEAYKRACITHGWQIPEDIARMSWS